MTLNITAAQLRELEVGQSVAQVHRIPHGAKDGQEIMRRHMENMRSNAGNKVARAKESTDGAVYKIETFSEITAGFAVLVGIAVTRTA